MYNILFIHKSSRRFFPYFLRRKRQFSGRRSLQPLDFRGAEKFVQVAADEITHRNLRWQIRGYSALFPAAKNAVGRRVLFATEDSRSYVQHPRHKK